MTDELTAAEAAWTKAKQVGVGEAEAKRRLTVARAEARRDPPTGAGDAVATPTSLAAKATNT